MSNTEALIKNNWAHLHFAEEDGRWQVTIRGVGLAAAAVRARLDAEGLKFSDTTVQQRGETVPAILVLAGDGWSYTVFHAKVMAALIQAKELHAIAGIAIAEDTGRTRVPFTLADLPPAPDESREDLLLTVADLQRELLDYKLAVVSCNGFYPFDKEVTPKSLREEIRRVVEERRILFGVVVEEATEEVAGEACAPERELRECAVLIRQQPVGALVQVVVERPLPGQKERFVSLIEGAVRQSLVIRQAERDDLFHVSHVQGTVAVITAARAVWGALKLEGWFGTHQETLDISIYQDGLTAAELSRIARAMNQERGAACAEPAAAPTVEWPKSLAVLGMLFHGTSDGYYALANSVQVPGGMNELEIEFNCEGFRQEVSMCSGNRQTRTVRVIHSFDTEPNTPEELCDAVSRMILSIDHMDESPENRWAHTMRLALGQRASG